MSCSPDRKIRRSDAYTCLSSEGRENTQETYILSFCAAAGINNWTFCPAVSVVVFVWAPFNLACFYRPPFLSRVSWRSHAPPVLSAQRYTQWSPYLLAARIWLLGYFCARCRACFLGIFGASSHWCQCNCLLLLREGDHILGQDVA